MSLLTLQFSVSSGKAQKPKCPSLSEEKCNDYLLMSRLLVRSDGGQAITSYWRDITGHRPPQQLVRRKIMWSTISGLFSSSSIISIKYCTPQVPTGFLLTYLKFLIGPLFWLHGFDQPANTATNRPGAEDSAPPLGQPPTFIRTQGSLCAKPASTVRARLNLDHSASLSPVIAVTSRRCELPG